MPSVKCTKPQEWNIGAAIIVGSPARSGILENSAAAGSSDSGCLRWAPLGEPVVPLVRITTRPLFSGATTSRGVAGGDEVLQRAGPWASRPRRATR